MATTARSFRSQQLLTVAVEVAMPHRIRWASVGGCGGVVPLLPRNRPLLTFP